MILPKVYFVKHCSSWAFDSDNLSTYNIVFSKRKGVSGLFKSVQVHPSFGHRKIKRYYSGSDFMKDICAGEDTSEQHVVLNYPYFRLKLGTSQREVRIL